MLMRGERMIVPSVETETGMPSASGPTSDFSASISITTMPSGLIRGVTPRIRPTFSSAMLFTCPVWLIVVPTIRGTRWPTWMKAGWLSSVMTCGRLRTSSRRDSCSARTSTLTLSLLAESTSPPKPSSLLTRPTAKFDRPCAADLVGTLQGAAGRRCCPSGGVVEVEARRIRRADDRWCRPRCRRASSVVVVVVIRSPSRLRSNSSESCRPSSTPNSSVLLSATSAISTWIITCGGCASSFSTSSLISSKNRGVALMISELLTGSGTTTTSLSICWKGLIVPGAACCTCRSLPQELVDRRGHVQRRGVLQPVDGVLALLDVLLVEPQQQRLDDRQVARRAGGDDAVGAQVDREPQGRERRFPFGRGQLRPARRRRLPCPAACGASGPGSRRRR